VPVDRLGQDAAGQQADRRARGGDEAEDADRLGLLGGLREHRHDHPEDDRGGQRAADALHEARADEHLLALRDAAQQRRDGEDEQAGEEDPPAADEVAEPAGEQQQAAEGDQVGVDDPGEVRLREPRSSWMAGSATFTIVVSRMIISIPDAEDDEGDPAAAVGLGSDGWGCDGLGHEPDRKDRPVRDYLLRN
jgi:hypothetical protein